MEQDTDTLKLKFSLKAIGTAFLDNAITNDLKNLVPGKRVLDIG